MPDAKMRPKNCGRCFEIAKAAMQVVGVFPESQNSHSNLQEHFPNRVRRNTTCRRLFRFRRMPKASCFPDFQKQKHLPQIVFLVFRFKKIQTHCNGRIQYLFVKIRVNLWF